VVPWTADYKFDAAVFRRQSRTIARHLTRHIYIFGMAGEGFTPDAGHRLAFLADDRRAYRVGPVAQLSLPAWGALNDVELDRFFAETCGRFPDCRFHHYNLARSGRVLTSVDYRRLAEAHPSSLR